MLQQNGGENSKGEEQRQEKERANESDNELNNEHVEQEVPPDKTHVKGKIFTKPHKRKDNVT